MRRMPADWSNLSRAEKRAWSIEFATPAKPFVAGDENAEAPEAASPEPGRRRWRRRRGAMAPSLAPPEVVHELPISNVADPMPNGNGHRPAAGADLIDLTDRVIDLTDARDDVVVTAEDA